MSETVTRATLDEPQIENRVSRGTTIALSMTGAVLFLVGLVWTLTVDADHEWWKIVTLGIVEGVTEFLPISSTGHLLVAAKALDFHHELGGTFEIFIQLGAVIAVIGYYLRDLLGQARAITRDRTTQHFWIGILIAFIPAAVVGLALHKEIQQYLFTPQVIAGTLIVGGIIFIIVELLPQHPLFHDLGSVPWLHALGIGLMQTLALVPGVSRSGGAIIGALVAGLDRRTATAFSFYLAIPTLGAATVADLVSSLDTVGPGDPARLFLGTVVSMIVAWLSIGWLLRYVSRNTFIPFGIYRILAGIVIIALLAVHVL